MSLLRDAFFQWYTEMKGPKRVTLRATACRGGGIGRRTSFRS